MSRFDLTLGRSPAARRYLRRSVLPVLACVPAGFFHGLVLSRLGDTLPLRSLASAPALALLAWMILDYLRFLNEADELERLVEVHALAWGAAAALFVALAAALIVHSHAQRLALTDAVGLFAAVYVIGYLAARIVVGLRYR